MQEAANAAAVEFKTVVARMVEMPDGSSALGVCSSPTFQGPSTAAGPPPKTPQPPHPPSRALWKACLAPGAVQDSPRASPALAAIASEPPSPSQLSIASPRPGATQLGTHCTTDAPYMARAQRYDSLGPQELRAICPHAAYLHSGVAESYGECANSRNDMTEPRSPNSGACDHESSRAGPSSEIVAAAAVQPAEALADTRDVEGAGTRCNEVVVQLGSGEACSAPSCVEGDTCGAASR